MKKLLFTICILSFLAASCNSIKVGQPSTIPTNTDKTIVSDSGNINCLEENNSDNGSTLLTQGLLFNLPNGWLVTKQNDYWSCIKTADKPYKVYMTLHVIKNAPTAASDFDYALANHEVNQTTKYAQIYSDPCGGAIDCDGAKIGKNYYAFTFDVQSTQPQPKELDGIWVPNYNFSQKDIDKILSTVRETK